MGLKNFDLTLTRIKRLYQITSNIKLKISNLLIFLKNKLYIKVLMQLFSFKKYLSKNI